MCGVADISLAGMNRPDNAPLKITYYPLENELLCTVTFLCQIGVLTGLIKYLKTAEDYLITTQTPDDIVFTKTDFISARGLSNQKEYTSKCLKSSPKF